MKHFAPILLLGANASSSGPDLLQTVMLENESKYLHLLGMDGETEMNHHGRSAVRDVEQAYLNLA